MKVETESTPDFERLAQIVEHLVSGQLMHKEFNFAVLNSSDPIDDSGCGSNGCAIGEFPAIWPNDWRFIKEYSPYKDNSPGVFYTPGLLDEYLSYHGVSHNVLLWLSLTKDQAEYLFYPACNNGFPKPGTVNQMPGNATRYEVTARIRKFIASDGEVEYFENE